MAYETLWYHSQLPDEVIDPLCKTLELSDNFVDSLTKSGADYTVRDSQNQWVPHTHWVCGLIWHYINLANDTNFGYDIEQFDGGSVQYTKYEAGQYYNWHKDDGVANQYAPSLANPEEDFIKSKTKKIRKLSVVVQLSSHEDYTGGEFQFMEDYNKTFFAPKKKGTIIIFDSRLPHRAKKVISGERRSLVGWVTGPQWK